MQLQDLPQPLITTYYDILRTTLNLPPSIVRREEQTELYGVDLLLRLRGRRYNNNGRT